MTLEKGRSAASSKPMIKKVRLRLQEEQDSCFCNGCGHRITPPAGNSLVSLPSLEKENLDVQQVVAEHRTAFEAALVRGKGLLRDRSEEKESPSCFISYAWGVSEDQRRILQLAKDMRNAGIRVLLDRWHNPPGTSITLFTDQILSADNVAVAGTPTLREKYDTQATDRVLAAELRLINIRLQRPTQYGPTVILRLLSGDIVDAFPPPMLQDLVGISLKEEGQYFSNLFGLIWRLYELPFDHPLLEDLQVSMSPQAESTISY